MYNVILCYQLFWRALIALKEPKESEWLMMKMDWKIITVKIPLRFVYNVNRNLEIFLPKFITVIDVKGRVHVLGELKHDTNENFDLSPGDNF